MDRDIALQITQKITAINTALQTLATNTAPTSANRSIPDANTRSVPDEDPGPDIVQEPSNKK